MLELGFVVLPVVLVLLVVFAWRRVSGNSGVGLLVALTAWLLVTGLAAHSGALAKFDARPPPFVVLLVSVVIATVVFVRSSVGRGLGDGLPLVALVAFQSFRLPLELLMHQAAVQGVMPPQMTFTGWNFDIVTGVTAIIVAALGAPRRLVIAWNVLGSVLVVTIVTIALVSSPMFKAFGDGAAVNTFVAHFPYVWLPAVMVMFAFAGHVMIFRRLRSHA